LSAHSELSNREIINAIKNTASNHDNPDSLFGWGIPDAEKAVTYFGPAFSNLPELEMGKDGVEIKTYVFSYYGLDKSSVQLHFLESNSEEKIYNMKEIDEDYFSCFIRAERSSNNIKFYFSAKDKRGYSTKFPSGFLGYSFSYSISNAK
jgi:hypothetical protein